MERIALSVLDVIKIQKKNDIVEKDKTTLSFNVFAKLIAKIIEDFHRGDL